MEREVTVSNLLGGVLNLLQKSAVQTAAYVLLVGGLGALGVVSGWGQETTEWGFRLGRTFGPDDGVAQILFALLTVVVGQVAGFLYLKSLYATRRPVSPGLSGFWPYLGLAIVSGLGTSLALILLIIPGIIVMIRWSAANGFLIGSDKAIVDSLSASWEATRGHSWPIFFAGLIVLVALAMFLVVVVGLASIGSQLLGEALSAVAEALLGAVFMILAANVYFLVDEEFAGDLREVFA